jgi:hypothetical protein
MVQEKAMILEKDLLPAVCRAQASDRNISQQGD